MWKVKYDTVTGRVLVKKTVIYKDEDRDGVLYFDTKPRGWWIDLNSGAVLTEPPSYLKIHQDRLSTTLPKTGLVPKGPRSACFVRLIGIGDVVMSIPTLEAFKRQYPKWTTTYITTDGAAQVLRYAGLLDRIVVVENKTVTELYPDPPVDTSDFELVVNWIGRVEFNENTIDHHRADLFLKYLNTVLDEYDMDTVQIPDDYQIPELELSGSDRKWANQYLERRGYTRGPLIGCQLNASQSTRTWDINKWMELTELVPAATFMVFSDKREYIDLEFPHNVINASSTLNAREYIALIALCDLLIGTDSSGLHIGALFRKPSIVLEGSTDVFKHIKYYDQDNICVLRSTKTHNCSPCYDYLIAKDCYEREDAPWCLNGIDPGAVAAEIYKRLEWGIVKSQSLDDSKEWTVFVRDDKGVGDVISTLSAVQLHRKKYPDTKIRYVGRYPLVTILENHPDIDELSDVNNWQEDTDSEHVVMFSHPCPAGEYESKRLAARKSVDKSRNEIFTLAAGLPWDGEVPILYVTRKEQEWARSIVTGQGFRIGVGLRSAETWKDWSHVFRFLRRGVDRGWNMYSIDQTLKSEVGGVVDLVGYSIREVLALITRMHCVVSPDTAIFHLAGAVGVPAVALFGSMDAELHASKFSTDFKKSNAHPSQPRVYEEPWATFIQGGCVYGMNPCMYNTCEGKGNFQPCMSSIPVELVENICAGILGVGGDRSKTRLLDSLEG